MRFTPVGLLPPGVTFDELESDHGGADVILLLQAPSHDATGFATRRYAEAGVVVRVDLGVSEQVEFLGYAFTQFAMPVVAGAGLDFDFHPAHNLRSPRAVLPLLARDSDRCILLAPLTNPHEQVITFADGQVQWGWHGDLDSVPAGFTTELGIYDGRDPSDVLARWGNDLRTSADVTRRARAANPVTSHVSYWTDNGAAYWYRTESAVTIAESVVAKVDELRTDQVPVRTVELDSWFYRHETPRAIAEFGYPDEVPPSGAMEWLPRPDAFPAASGEPSGEPIAELSRRTHPLILHARHVSPRSPYVDDTWWVDRAAAHPSDPTFFRRWFDDARRWGAVCIEQDWMLMYWFGVREMRRVAGRALEWQRALDAHADATDVDLIWCMATPADLIAAVHFDRVIAVRSADDYRFTTDPALLWTWFLTVNRLVAPLGLWPFKDCFFSDPDPDGDDPISGDVHAELEALLSALSGGPVGIGDRIGRTNRDIVMRTCDEEGRLLQPHTPIGMIDDCLFGAPARGDGLAWAAASTTHGTDTWTYVVAINTAAENQTIDDVLDLAAIGIDSARHVHDWRGGNGAITPSISTRLASRDWAFHIVCPAGSTDVGDTSKYVTAARLTRDATSATSGSDPEVAQLR